MPVKLDGTWSRIFGPRLLVGYAGPSYVAGLMDLNAFLNPPTTTV